MIRKLNSWKNLLIPGVGLKRWLVLIFLGITLLAFGLAVIVLDFYRNAPETWWLPALATASLRWLPRPLRVVIFGGIGLSLLLVGLFELNRALIKPFIRPGKSVVNTLLLHHQRERGPKIVAVGGGHGLSTLLRGLKGFTNNLTAVVTVADDGGSSGILRKELGILPPGDIRNCLAALSDDEEMLGQLFQYRFAENSGFQGHSFGNLFISVLAELTGSFEQAVAESGRVLAVHGQVLPSTLHDVTLQADVILPDTIHEVRVHGESKIPESTGLIRRVWLEPNNPPAFPKVIQAILQAEIIVVGPGSLFTSILPNLLVPDLSEAVRASRALKIYVCNIATQHGETDGFQCADHIRVIENHIGSQMFDVILCNNNYQGELPKGVDWVKIETELMDNYPVSVEDLVDLQYPYRHDGQKLSRIILELFQEKTGPLVES